MQGGVEFRLNFKEYKKLWFFDFYIFFLVSPVTTGEFSISFEWGDIPSCSNGQPNSVPNPIFVLLNVPKGTKYIVLERHIVYFSRRAIYSSHSEGISCFFWVLHSLQQGTRLNFSDLPPRAKGMI